MFSLNVVFYCCLHMEQQPILSFTAVALLVIGLVGNGLRLERFVSQQQEMRNLPQRMYL